MKKLAVQKPYFLTWLGTYFFIYHSDVFIAMDDTLFLKEKDVYNLWHRNTFNTNDENNSLAIPITFGTKKLEKVHEIEIKHEIRFIQKHLTVLGIIFKDCKYTNEVIEQVIKPIYFKKHRYLADFNIDLIFSVCNYLGIKTDHIKRSSQLNYATSLSRDKKYFDYLQQENCSHLMVDEGLAELLTQEQSIDEDNLFFCPIKQILPEHYNILDLLCKYGPETINFIKKA